MKHRLLLSIFIFLLAACSHKNNEKVIEQFPVNDTIVADIQEPVEPINIVIEKELLYDQYTLEDVYPYKDTTRVFQWDQIKQKLELLETVQREPASWGVLQNRNNKNGEAPLAPQLKRNAYHNLEDAYGVERYQSAPLFHGENLETPVRYGQDGMLVKILEFIDTADFVKIASVFLEEEWMVPKQYVYRIADTIRFFNKAIFVDRNNQNISTLEKTGGKWLVRSMNPVTTGVHKPPYQKETPLGIFVLQEKKQKMFYLVDGTSKIAGYAPYASRFNNGGYIHGIPTNDPNGSIIEYSWSLGTTPRSHMCVRNASSHAQFVFNWAPVDQSLVFVIE